MTTRGTLNRFLIVAVLAAAPSAGADDGTFDVSSVRHVTTPPGPPAPRLDCVNGRFISSGFYPTQVIFQWAYDLDAGQIRGNRPGWFSDYHDTYSIEATATEPVSLARCKVMVQQLLKDRFGVQVTRSVVEQPGYSLVQGEQGPRLQEVGEDAPPGGVIIHGHPYYDANSQQPRGWTMAELASYLSRQPTLDNRRVVDRTGLTGRYRIKLDFAFLADQDGPSLFTALTDQLGLRLESIRTPVDIVTIDHVERPGSN